MCKRQMTFTERESKGEKRQANTETETERRLNVLKKKTNKTTQNRKKRICRMNEG